MTNSLLPKTPLHQETLDRLLVLLRQPFSIAVLASLAAHGLLWAALPNVLDQKEPETQRRVQVVALSPAEQGQLPPLGINPVPQIVPVKPLQPTQSGTKLPDPKYNDSLLSTIPVLPLSPPTFPIDLSNLLPKSLPEPKNETKKQATAPDKTKNPPVPPVNPGASNTNQNPVKPTDTPTAPARVDKLSSEQIAKRLQEGERSRVQSLYAFSDPETKEGESGRIFNANVGSFAEAAKVAHSDIDDKLFYKEPQKVIDFFPKDACPFVLKGRNASFGAIVKPDGKLAETTVLLTSGYKGLDVAAVEYIPTLLANLVQQKKIDNDGKFKLIRFEFNFDPKSFCSRPA